jgi:Na+/proline symporter
MSLLLATILLLGILCAMTAVASHIHVPGEGSSESHCLLCMFGATLIAVVMAVVLGFFWRHAFVSASSSFESFQLIRVFAHSIRPPPQANCSL